MDLKGLSSLQELHHSDMSGLLFLYIRAFTFSIFSHTPFYPQAYTLLYIENDM